MASGQFVDGRSAGGSAFGAAGAAADFSPDARWSSSYIALVAACMSDGGGDGKGGLRDESWCVVSEMVERSFHGGARCVNPLVCGCRVYVAGRRAVGSLLDVTGGKTIDGNVCGGKSGNCGSSVCSPVEVSEDVGVGRDCDKPDFEHQKGSGVAVDLGGSLASTGSTSLSKKTKHARYRNNKRARRNAASVCGDGDFIKDGRGSVSGSGGDEVPEWRRKSNVGPARYVAGLINEAEDPALLQSVKDKWIAKNKLQKAKDERELKMLMATDVEAEVSRRNAAARASYERALVSIEKSHSRLVRSDCVPDDELTDEQRLQRGTVHTVLSSSISPGSSASMAEFREMQKKVLDLEKRNEDLEKRHILINKACDKLGISVGNLYYNSKSLWTCDEAGDLSPENCDLLCGEDIGYTIADLPEKGADGKFRVPVNVF